MVKAFGDESMPSAGCLSHSLQLVIKSDLLGLPSVTKLIEKVRKVVSFANHSDKFYVEFRRQQRFHNMEDGEQELVLIQDVATRWNSTFYMLERFLRLKSALIASIAHCEDLDYDVKVEFRKDDWSLMEKVVKVLKSFEEATQMLSTKNACISQTIPIITLIIQQLNTTKADTGVKTLKRDLQDAMEARFDHYESDDKYTLSTLLDPRFKGLMFRKKDTLREVKERLIHLLETELQDVLDSDQNMNLDASMNMEEETRGHTLAATMAKIRAKSINQQENSPLMEATQFVEQYINSKVVETEEEVLEFWKSKASSIQAIDKMAAKLAEFYLTPPATSVDVERLFSTAGDIRTQERNRLLPENAGKILFLKENLPRVDFVY